jgi:hypothetical protein
MMKIMAHDTDANYFCRLLLPAMAVTAGLQSRHQDIGSGFGILRFMTLFTFRHLVTVVIEFG